MTKPIRSTENLHILLWIFKDSCWCFDLKLAGVGMILPTLIVAGLITWRMRDNREELTHNVAVFLWICANSVWMIGEFYFNDTTRPYALVFFVLGLIVLASHYVPRWVRSAMALTRKPVK
jgi:hypothetical protein